MGRDVQWLVIDDEDANADAEMENLAGFEVLAEIAVLAEIVTADEGAEIAHVF